MSPKPQKPALILRKRRHRLIRQSIQIVDMRDSWKALIGKKLLGC